MQNRGCRPGLYLCRKKGSKVGSNYMGFSCQSPMLNKFSSAMGCSGKNWSEIVISLWAWMNQAHIELSPKIGNWIGKKTNRVLHIHCAPSPWQLRLSAPELHREPLRRKLLSAAATTRNGQRNHLHLRFHLLNKDPPSKFSNS